MQWNQSTMYEQRVRFILEVQQRTFSFAESCRRYGISRTAGYTWWNRFLTEGFEGLYDRSHRPHHCPHAVADPFVEHIVDLRQRYGWGSRKIRKVSTNGGIRWHSRWINISSALGNEFVGLEPIGPALWQVYFGPITLGWFDEELFVIFDTHGNTGRNPIC